MLKTATDSDLALQTVMRQMLDELRRIRLALERDRRPSTLTRADRAALGRETSLGACPN